MATEWPAATALFRYRSLDGQQRFLECRQIVFHGVPDNLAVYPLILVAQDVADTGDVLPAHILVLRFELAAEVAAGFGNDFYTALHQPSLLPVGLEFVERGPIGHRPDVLNRFDDVLKPRGRRAGGH